MSLIHLPIKAEKSDVLDDMMEKSKNSLLVNDGLSTLSYTTLNAKRFPLYTWMLVKLPDPPKKAKKSLWATAQKSLWAGMSAAVGGVAKNIAEKASDFAGKAEEEHEAEEDTIY